MSTEVTPAVRVFLTAQEFAKVNGRVASIDVQRLGFLAAADLVGYNMPDDVPTSIVIGDRREVLPFLETDDAEIFSADMLGSPNPQSFMLHGLDHTNVLAFYIDNLTTEAASYGLAAAMQADDRQKLRVDTVMDIALGLSTASVSMISDHLGAPNAATAIIAVAGSGTLIWRRLKHAADSGYLIAERSAAASHEPIIVKAL